MGRINSIEKITSNLVNNIQNASLKAVQGEIENTVRFFVGTVVNLDSLNGRAKVRYMSVENNDYMDIECAIKTEELIKINDIVIVLYIRNLANAFIFAKMTSNYYSKSTKASNEYTDIALGKYVTLSTNQNILGSKTFEAETTTFNQIIAFTNKANPYIRFESKDSSTPNLTPTSFYVQGYENNLAIGPGVSGGTATIWNKNGVVTFPLIPNVTGNQDVSVINEKGNEYIRYADGTQICWHYYPISDFSTGVQSLAFPKAFATGTSPVVVFNPVTSRGTASYDRETCPNTISNTGITLHWNTGISYLGYCLFAVGNWR